MARSKAWMLTSHGGFSFAVGELAMVEYSIEAEIFPVPLTPKHCPAVAYWRRRFVPIINYGKLFDPQVNDDIRQIGVLAYQTQPHTPLQHVAIALDHSPRSIIVDDEQACELPMVFAYRYPDLAISSFAFDDKTIPILDIGYLCSAAFVTRQSSKKTQGRSGPGH